MGKGPLFPADGSISQRLSRRAEGIGIELGGFVLITALIWIYVTTGGPLALLDEAPGVDVVFCAHVGLEAFASISDIPRGERDRIEWLYSHWQLLDDWVGLNI